MEIRKKEKEEEMKAFIEEYNQATGKGPGGKNQRKKRVLDKKKLETLCQPKDRMKVGKTLLEMKSRFPKDRILNDMIVQEFQEKRIAKKPLEYEFVDSEEEERLRVAEGQAKKKEDKDELVQEGAEYRELDLEKDKRERAEEILGRFTEILQKYNEEKTQAINTKKTSKSDRTKYISDLGTFMS